VRVPEDGHVVGGQAVGGDAPSPHDVPRVLRLGVRHQQPPARGLDAVGEYDEVTCLRRAVGEVDAGAATSRLEAHDLAGEGVLPRIQRGGAEQPEERVPRREAVRAGLRVHDRTVAPEILLPRGRQADVGQREPGSLGEQLLE
jgi:hypothetical protein